MAKLDLASSEWCQLIFEGKNQAYGAYRMRANSTKRHNVAMLIVVVIAAVGFSIPTLLKLATPEQKEVMTEVTTLSKLEEPEIKQEEMKRVEPVAPHTLRNLLPCTSAEFPDTARDISRRHELRRVRVYKGDKGRRVSGHGFQMPETVLAALAHPLSSALLDQPETDDVFQERCLAAASAFICHIAGK